MCVQIVFYSFDVFNQFIFHDHILKIKLGNYLLISCYLIYPQYMAQLHKYAMLTPESVSRIIHNNHGQSIKY
jgi:hypothetical protein